MRDSYEKGSLAHIKSSGYFFSWSNTEPHLYGKKEEKKREVKEGSNRLIRVRGSLEGLVGGL